ncbi:MAG: lytic transglycosylase domain-containing protein [Bdellovibrionales bacterium]|nr:lytic transglycosylase domain-containing protein [Bdellovibrionales bacterium]
MRHSAFAHLQKIEVQDHLSLSDLRQRVGSAKASVRTSPHLLALLSLVSALGLCTVVLLANTFVIPLPGILSGDSSAFSEQFVTPNSYRERYLQNLEAEQKRELAKSVHFLSGIIASENPRVASKSKEIAYLIASESRAANIDPILVAAVVKSESTFKENARSHVGALGFMQVMPQTGQFVSKVFGLPWKGKSVLLNDGRYNLTLGIAYLQYLLDKYDGDFKTALWAYNWGPSNVQRLDAGEAQLPSVTKHYAKTILADFSKWKQAFAQRQTQYKFFNASYLGKKL